jgi:hypothetical protein
VSAVNASSTHFVVVFNLNGAYSANLGYSDLESARKGAATAVASQKGGTAIVFERVAQCQLPTPSVEWVENKK